MHFHEGGPLGGAMLMINRGCVCFPGMCMTFSGKIVFRNKTHLKPHEKDLRIVYSRENKET